uniref:Uncharacterized protein n=1 Tax=Glossina brevipalpis TaxID=37001 RepID=A0A1A9WWS9_9MUSC
MGGVSSVVRSAVSAIVRVFSVDIRDGRNYSGPGDYNNYSDCTYPSRPLYGFSIHHDLETEDSGNERDLYKDVKNVKRMLRTFKVIYPLSLYQPSEDMKAAQTQQFSLNSLKANNNVMSAYLENSELHSENVHIIFRQLLEIEDLTTLCPYSALQQKGVTLHFSGDREYWAKLNNTANDIAEIVAPLMDEVIVVPRNGLDKAVVLRHDIDIMLPPEHELRRCAVVTSISKDVLKFRFNIDKTLEPLNINPQQKFDLIIRPMRLPLRYQYRALELLKMDIATRRYLFPSEKNIRFLKILTANSNQQKCIVNNPNLYAPYIIFGPPGTGKTTTVVETILQLQIKNSCNRILVTASSNSACDTIALGICRHINRSQLLKSRTNLLIRLFSNSVVANQRNLIDPELLKRSNCSGSHYYPAIEDIRNYSIIVTTLCTVGKLATGGIGDGNFFTHIFIDEAGACSEPEALVGIMDIKSRNCKIILSGDHKQLGPVFKSERAAELGLSKSLMERLLETKCYLVDQRGNYDRNIQFRLKQNYRSHPKILELFNHLYYNDELQSKAKPADVNMAVKWNKLTNANFPIIFQSVCGRTEKDKRSESYFNNDELEVSMDFLENLLIDGIDGCRVKQEDIAVISPYKEQCKRIKEKLKCRKWSLVETGTVNAFQGREKHIIIISLVKSFTSLGFVDEPRRLNVMLSRAKSLLIIIGNPKTLHRSSHFRYILNECSKNGTFLNNEKAEIPTRMKRRRQRKSENKKNL